MRKRICVHGKEGRIISVIQGEEIMSTSGKSKRSLLNEGTGGSIEESFIYLFDLNLLLVRVIYNILSK